VSPSFVVETVEVCVKCVLGVCVCVCVCERVRTCPAVNSFMSIHTNTVNSHVIVDSQNESSQCLCYFFGEPVCCGRSASDI